MSRGWTSPRRAEPAEAEAEAEVAARLPVWSALSELFRDTELQPFDYDGIAREIAEAGVSAAEARRVLDREVAPAFHANLLSPAGEWAGWPDAAVREVVLRHLRAPPWSRALSRASARAFGFLWRDGWREVERRLPPS